MNNTVLAPNIKTYTNNTFSLKELAFISAYLANGCNAAQAVISAGYNCKRPDIIKNQPAAGGRKEKENECNISSIRYKTIYNNR